MRNGGTNGRWRELTRDGELMRNGVSNEKLGELMKYGGTNERWMEVTRDGGS